MRRSRDHRLCRAAAFATALVAAVTPASGQDDEPIETVEVVEQARDPIEITAPTIFATVIDADLAADYVKDVGDALSESVGVQVRRFGGLGAFSTVSIRGSSAKQVAVYLDGISLSRADDETVSLSDLPIDSLDRIEVYRGQTPIGFGSGGIGGVVNLVTRQPSDVPSTEFKLAYGSFNTAKIVASHTRRWRGFDVLGHVSYLGSEGDFSFYERSPEPGAPPQPIEMKRQNNQIDSVGALLKVGRDLDEDLRLDLTSDLFFKDQGLAGIGRNQSDSASLSDVRSINVLRLQSYDSLGLPLDSEVKTFVLYDRSNFDNRDGDLFGVNQDVINETIAGGASIGARWLQWSTHVPEMFLSMGGETFDSHDDVRPQDDTQSQDRLRLSTALQDRFYLWPERITLVPTLRYEHLRDTFGPIDDELGREDLPRQTKKHDLWSPSIGAEVDVLPWLQVNGNIGRFERPPNLEELFGSRGFVQGNSRLRSETGINRDIGLRAGWCALDWIDSVSFEYAYFDNDIDDLIVLVQLSQQYFRPENIGNASIHGHEISGHLSAWRHWVVDLNYTRQDARNQSDIPSQDGKRLPGRPQDELFFRLAFEHELGSVYYELNHIAGNYLDRVNFRRVDSRELHAAGVGLQPRSGLRFGIDVRNFTNEHTEDVAGFPLPGRSAFVTLKWEL